MIDLRIKVEGDKVIDGLNVLGSTLSENAIIIRRLEQAKQRLLSIKYEDTSVESGGFAEP